MNNKFDKDQSQCFIRELTTDAIDLVNILDKYKNKRCEAIIRFKGNLSVSNNEKGDLIAITNNKVFWNEVKIFSCASEGGEYVRNHFDNELSKNYSTIRVIEFLINTIAELRKKIDNEFLNNVSEILKSSMEED